MVIGRYSNNYNILTLQHKKLSDPTQKKSIYIYVSLQMCDTSHNIILN